MVEFAVQVVLTLNFYMIVIMLLILFSAADVRPLLVEFPGEHKQLSLDEDPIACDHTL